MKKVLLKSISLRNFKGIVNLTIEIDGSANLYAANEVGKSTIYTAFNWNLTGKDEFDRKDYEIKNTKRKELNSQSHEVELVLVVSENGIETENKLKRVYLEKWTKPKGQSTKVFEGHKTEFWYNDVPCNLTEYQAKVDAIIDSRIIKMVTNPTFFNSLKWEDQRRGLLSIAGNITNEDIFNSIATPDNDFSTLIMVLNSGKSVEEYRKELTAKKGLLKKSALEFQPRIDELKRGMLALQNWNAIENKIVELSKELDEVEASLADASTALSQKQKGLMGKQKMLHDFQTELANKRFKVKSELLARQNDSSGAIEKVKAAILATTQNIGLQKKKKGDAESNIAAYKRHIDSYNEVINQCRAKWSEINAEKFVFDESKCECPTCKQQLPAADIEAQKERLLKNFNESVLRRKNEQVFVSNQAKAEKKQLEENIAALEAINYTEEIAAAEENLTALQGNLSTLTANKKQQTPEELEVAVDALLQLNADYLNLQDEIAALEEEIKQENETLSAGTNNIEIKTRKVDLINAIDAEKAKLSSKDQIVKTNKRIAELENEEKANAQAIADIEKQEFEVETYTRAKMDILETKVNKLFKYVQFKLFKNLINGGIEEACECQINGVPYSTANKASQLNAGLDIIRVMGNHYGIQAPVIIDNRESITNIIEMEAQVISLIVSPDDKQLRVEQVSVSKQHKEAA
jgi:DNA repair protein SbcC/Rad50